MTDQQYLNTKIANVSLEIPIYEDISTTKHLISKIEEKLHQIEQESPRVDSQAFALQVAYDFAVELHRANRKAEGNNKDILVALDALQSRLHELVNRQSQKD